MSEQTSDTTDRLTSTPQNRAPGQGVNAPSNEGGAEGPIQSSVFDAGEEVVVVTDTDEAGQRKQGTGADASEATADAQDKSEPIGEGFGTASH